ncbi:MAG: DUF378 domain-containing protein [Candidatus Borkfalkiaceae bacterium]|nr:DUF378 domain-containing protein [Christensenellaceae bacterium]
MKLSGILSYILVALGALLWLIFGLLNINVIGEIFGYRSIIARYIYVGIGIGGMFFIYVSLAFHPLKGL